MSCLPEITIRELEIPRYASIPRNIYLSAPYRGTPAEVEKRMQYISLLIQTLRSRGHYVTSALLHHWTIPAVDESATSDYWLRYSEMLVRAIGEAAKYDNSDMSAEVWLLCLYGWRQSSGVRAELEMARQPFCNLPIRYFKPDNFGQITEITSREATLID